MINYGFTQKNKAFYDNATVDEVRRYLYGVPEINPAEWSYVLPPAGDPTRDKAIAKLHYSQAPENLVSQAIYRHLNATTSRLTQWFLQLEDPAEPALTLSLSRWWDHQNVWAVVRESMLELLVSGRQGLRVYIPKRFKNSLVGDASEIIKHIRVSTCQLSEALDDDDELEYVECKGERHEMLEDGRYKITISTDSGAKESIEMETQGRWMVYTFERQQLVDAWALELQRSINREIILMGLNTLGAGFTERFILNAAYPEDGYYMSGPATATSLQPAVIENEDGSKIVVPASAKFKEPSSNKNILESIDAHRVAFFRHVNQSHVIMNPNLALSEQSRNAAEADFRNSLALTASVQERLISWIVEAVTILATELAGTPIVDKNFKCISKVVVSSGVIPRDRADVALQMHRDGLLSAETVNAAIGFSDDNEGEQSLITDEAAVGLDGSLSPRLDSVVAAYSAGLLGSEEALRVAFPRLPLGVIKKMASSSIDVVDNGVSS